MRRGGPELIVLVIAGMILLALLAVTIFFYLTLQRCLSNIQPRNRDMEPGMVWLNLIPCFHAVWIFLTVLKIGSSLQKEFRSRRWPVSNESFGVGVGMGYAVCMVIGMIPYVGALAGIPGLICWIIYWVQIAGYSSRLQAEPFDDRRGFDDDFDDDFTERRSRRRRRVRDDEFDDDLEDSRRSRYDPRDTDERIQDRPPRRHRGDEDEPDERIRPR